MLRDLVEDVVDVLERESYISNHVGHFCTTGLNGKA